MSFRLSLGLPFRLSFSVSFGLSLGVRERRFTLSPLPSITPLSRAPVLPASETTLPDLSWVDEFIPRVRPYIFVRAEDRLLIKRPNQAQKLNPTGVRIPESLLAGGILLTLADTLARTVMAPVQLPVGVLTAMLGVPTFLYLLYRSRG